MPRPSVYIGIWFVGFVEDCSAAIGMLEDFEAKFQFEEAVNVLIPVNEFHIHMNFWSFFVESI